jgi:hypothetical protein
MVNFNAFSVAVVGLYKKAAGNKINPAIGPGNNN